MQLRNFTSFCPNLDSIKTDNFLIKRKLLRRKKRLTWKESIAHFIATEDRQEFTAEIFRKSENKTYKTIFGLKNLYGL